MSHGNKSGEATGAKTLLRPSTFRLFLLIPIMVVCGGEDQT
jgi:hypothetical protein